MIEFESSTETGHEHQQKVLKSIDVHTFGYHVDTEHDESEGCKTQNILQGIEQAFPFCFWKIHFIFMVPRIKTSQRFESLQRYQV